MSKLYYNPLLEDDDCFHDNRSEWERYVEGLEQAEKMNVDDWFNQLDADRNPF